MSRETRDEMCAQTRVSRFLLYTLTYMTILPFYFAVSDRVLDFLERALSPETS